MDSIATKEKKIILKGVDPVLFYGAHDSNLRLLDELLDVRVIARGNEILLSGEDAAVENAENLITELIYMYHKNGGIDQEDIRTVIRLADWTEGEDKNLNDVILYTKKYAIQPRTDGQKVYYHATQNNEIVCAIGPAGTGKTFLAVAIAIARLRDKEVNRIILCRPAVEAGENLGFLPGDFREKIDPYLRPLYDALESMVPTEKLKRQLDSHIIEIVPLAYMRGRTLDNCFVILDEAQNTTPLQMKMFLTRLGVNSRAIITGDITQVDLPSRFESGLIQIQSILKGIDGIQFIYLCDKDVVRHRLVREIIKAYEEFSVSKMNKE